MRLEVLISTMHQNDYSILDRMRIDSDAVVINQCDKNKVFSFNKNGHLITWIDTTERGLSKSRNMAIRNSNADVCLISDDDEVFMDDYENLIIDSFKKNDKYDILTFKIKGIEKHFKDYKNVQYKINFRKSLKVSSVEIAFLREKIVNNNLYFDELLGSGSKFKMGEENVFLIKCLKQKLKISYIPIYISQLHVGNSSWFSGFNESYFVDRGASYAGMGKYISLLLIIIFAIKKYRIYKNDISIFIAIKNQLDGRRQYLIKRKEN